MKRFIIFLLVLIAAVWLGITIAKDPGFALFAYNNWTVEMPLWLAGLLLVTAFLVGYGFIQLFKAFANVGKRIKGWRLDHKINSALRKTNRGLLELAEGKWETAEQLLIAGVEHNNTPLINYLAAARAAQEQGAYERRDDYLRLAHESTPGAEVAVSLTQAQLQLSHHQLEHGLATLRHLQNVVPRHAYVLKLLKQLYGELGDWKSLLELLPELRKRKVISAENIDQLEKQVYHGILIDAVNNQDKKELDKLWKNIPRNLHQEKALVIPYVESLLGFGDHHAAETILRDCLKNSWDSELVSLYGLVKSEKPAKQMEIAENWLRSHGNSPALLLCLARICMRNQFWGKTKDYLQTSIELEPTAAAYAELGKLYEELGKAQNALACYRKGFEII